LLEDITENMINTLWNIYVFRDIIITELNKIFWNWNCTKWYNLTNVSETGSVLGRNLPQTDCLNVQSYQNYHDSDGVILYNTGWSEPITWLSAWEDFIERYEIHV